MELSEIIENGNGQETREMPGNWILACCGKKKPLTIREQSLQREANANKLKEENIKKYEEFKYIYTAFLSKKYVHFDRKINALAKERTQSPILIRRYLKTYYENYATLYERHDYEEKLEMQSKNYTVPLKEKMQETFNIFISKGIHSPEFTELTKKYGVSKVVLAVYAEKYFLLFANSKEKEMYCVINDNKDEIMTPVEKEQEQIEYFRTMFTTCLATNYDDDSMEETAKSYRISLLNYKSYIQTYLEKYATEIEKNQYTEIYKQGQANNSLKQQQNKNISAKGHRYNVIIESLYLPNTAEEAIKSLLEKNICSEEHFEKVVSDFLKLPSKKRTIEEEQNFKANFKRILDNFNLALNENKSKKIIAKNLGTKKAEETKEKSAIKKAQMIINEFIISGMTLYDFCQNNRINNFDSYLMILSQNDKPLYELYCKKMEYLGCFKEQIVHDQLNRIVDGIKKGILNSSGEKIREFDILDYYSITNINVKEFGMFCRNKQWLCKTDHISKVGLFFDKYEFERVITDEQFLDWASKETTEINCRFDDNHMPISGTGEIITNSKQIMFVDYLKSKELKLTLFNYKAVHNRYRDHFLFINEEGKIVEEEPQKILTLNNKTIYSEPLRA